MQLFSKSFTTSTCLELVTRFASKNCNLLSNFANIFPKTKKKKIEDPKECQFRAKQIYDKYFSDKSQYQINVSSNIVTQLKKRLETQNIDSSLYQPAQSAVFSLLEMDSFPRFLQSEKYQSYKGTYPNDHRQQLITLKHPNKQKNRNEKKKGRGRPRFDLSHRHDEKPGKRSQTALSRKGWEKLSRVICRFRSSRLDGKNTLFARQKYWAISRKEFGDARSYNLHCGTYGTKSIKIYYWDYFWQPFCVI